MVRAKEAIEAENAEIKRRLATIITMLQPIVGEGKLWPLSLLTRVCAFIYPMNLIKGRCSWCTTYALIRCGTHSCSSHEQRPLSSRNSSGRSGRSTAPSRSTGSPELVKCW